MLALAMSCQGRTAAPVPEQPTVPPPPAAAPALACNRDADCQPDPTVGEPHRCVAKTAAARDATTPFDRGATCACLAGACGVVFPDAGAGATQTASTCRDCVVSYEDKCCAPSNCKEDRIEETIAQQRARHAACARKDCYQPKRAICTPVSVSP
ncbi:MAG: hypothetical protein IPL79_15015 [Myxococcales bacterium]|nr:hypothetical protein [Myxococcales bacterium]